MGADTMNGQSFSFLAFKWHDTSSSVDETQRVACNIEVSATAFATEVVQTCEGEQLVTQPTVITQSPPTNPPDTTADVEITVSTTQSTTTTLPVVPEDQRQNCRAANKARGNVG